MTSALPTRKALFRGLLKDCQIPGVVCGELNTRLKSSEGKIRVSPMVEKQLDNRRITSTYCVLESESMFVKARMIKQQAYLLERP